MKKLKEVGATLPLDFESDDVGNDWRGLYTEDHLSSLRHHWAKMERSHKLFSFNHEMHSGLFKKDSRAFLKLIIDAKIKHLSDWAKSELESRE